VQPVAVRILHPIAGRSAGPLERALADARLRSAERVRDRFGAAGAADVDVVAGQPDGRSFGARLRDIAGEVHSSLGAAAGLVVLGSGSVPLATVADARAFVVAAAAADRRVLANNAYSADVVAVSQAENLAAVPDLPGDNSLPRWLADEAGYEVSDLRRRWRLAVDLDSPLDLLLVGRPASGIDGSAVEARLRSIRTVASDPRAELVVAGRTSAATLRWLERSTASRTRALVEERGLRAGRAATWLRRPPRATLGLLLDERGPGALGTLLQELGDAALIDSRVLLAHRLGPDEARWPPAEDRFAADLLLVDGIRDPWLRELTRSARDARIPVLLGGHTLVGPGVPLALRAGRP